MSSTNFYRCLVALLLPALGLSAAILNCPFANSQCKCEYNAPFFSVSCLSPNVSVIVEMSDNVAALELSSLNRTSVPLDLLQNSILHTLIVTNSTLDAFSHTTNLNLTNLHNLALENVTFSHAPEWEEFSGLRHLKSLFLHNTTIDPILSFNFSHHLSKSLESVVISKCNVTNVEAGSFNELVELKNLRISHNELETFSADALFRPSKLEQLRLDYNRIHSLPAGVFDDMPHLKTVSLSNNTLSTLPEDVFSALWRPGVHLELRDNPIKCDCRMQWITTATTKPDEIVGQCAHPKKLFGRNIKDITQADLRC